jgi:hypothetical protein
MSACKRALTEAESSEGASLAKIPRTHTEFKSINGESEVKQLKSDIERLIKYICKTTSFSSKY